MEGSRVLAAVAVVVRWRLVVEDEDGGGQNLPRRSTLTLHIFLHCKIVCALVQIMATFTTKATVCRVLEGEQLTVYHLQWT